MKSIISLFIFGILTLVGLSAAITGTVIMVSSTINSSGEFPVGFLYFSLGSLLSASMLIMYSIVKMAASMQILTEIATQNMIAQTLTKFAPQGQPSSNPLEELFKKIARDSADGSLGSGRIKMFRMDENGDKFFLGEKEFKSHEDLVNFRDELLAGKLGKDEKQLGDMSITELEVEELKAVSTQDFELASSIRDLITEKKNK